jgi:hypothetical protein
MASEFLLARIDILCYGAGMAESYATQFARKGGKARAKKLTPEQRTESARKAVEARWEKQRKLAQEIKEGSAALLRKAQAAQARLAKTKKAPK